MKKYPKALILILVCLTILVPLASNAPDGLERVAETLGIEEHEPLWTGLMPDYNLPAIDNPYISTVLAGTFGTLLVLGVAYIIGIALSKPKNQ